VARLQQDYSVRLQDYRITPKTDIMSDRAVAIELYKRQRDRTYIYRGKAAFTGGPTS